MIEIYQINYFTSNLVMNMDKVTLGQGLQVQNIDDNKLLQKFKTIIVVIKYMYF